MIRSRCETSPLSPTSEATRPCASATARPPALITTKGFGCAGSGRRGSWSTSRRDRRSRNRTRGSVSLSMGDPNAALDYFRLAQAGHDALPAAALQPLQTWRELAALRQRLGLSSLRAGDISAGCKYLEEAQRLRPELVRLMPGSGAMRRNVALSHCDLADLELLHDDNPLQAALLYCGVALTFEHLLKLTPDNSLAREDLAFVDYRLGVTCERQAAPSIGLSSVPWSTAARLHLGPAHALLKAISNPSQADTGVRIRLLLATARCGL